MEVVWAGRGVEGNRVCPAAVLAEVDDEDGVVAGDGAVDVDESRAKPDVGAVRSVHYHSRVEEAGAGFRQLEVEFLSGGGGGCVDVDVARHERAGAGLTGDER